MVQMCAVYGCNNRGNRAGASNKTEVVSFFRFPSTRSICVDLRKLIEKRRKLWYQFLKRKDITLDDVNDKDYRICSEHFITGKPANTSDTEHIDWVPSLNAPNKKTDKGKIIERYERRQSRNQNHVDESNEIPRSVLIEQLQLQVGKLEKEKVQQSNLNAQLQRENERLKLENNMLMFKEEAFIENDEKLKFFTGLPNLDMFYVVMHCIEKCLYDIQVRKLSNFQKLLITLMKLRLNNSFRQIGALYIGQIGNLNSSWKDVRRLIRDDTRFSKFSSSDRKCEKEFKEYIKDKLVTIKSDFRELLQVSYHGKRRKVLNEEKCGTFLVRICERVWGYAISCKDAVGVKHYLIDASSGHFKILGTDHISHNTLGDLISYYKIKPLTMNTEELLRHPCPKSRRDLSALLINAEP